MALSHYSTVIILCISQHTHRHQTHGLVMHLPPYSCVSVKRIFLHRHQTHGLKSCIFCQTSVHQPAYVQTPNARHVSTAILLCISQYKESHQTHGLKPYIYYHTTVHQPAWADTKRMAWRHASTTVFLCISQRIRRHKTHVLKPCIYCHTTVHRPAYTQSQIAWS